MYHRTRMWDSYERTQGYNPQDHFLKALEKLRNHQPQYLAAIQQGIIELVYNSQNAPGTSKGLDE